MQVKQSNKANQNKLTTYVPPTLALGSKDKPTFDMYGFVQAAFDHFNRELYDNELPQCILTFQREKNIFGYFSEDRWEGKAGTRHEIALNPYFFVTHNPLELFQTLVHEMCHLWQHEYGKPSRRSYHNKEWADKMESMGLMPSHTGAPGGKRTGQKMADYPIDGGRFFHACVAFSKAGYALPYVDRIRAHSKPSEQIRVTFNLEDIGVSTSLDMNTDASDEEIKEAVNSLLKPLSEQFQLDEQVLAEQETVRVAKQKTTFQCPECGDKAWGKPSLNLVCGNCDVNFEVV